MAMCPQCRRHFRTIEDEAPDECPYCGFGRHEDEPDPEPDFEPEADEDVQ